ncbi:MAG: GNAT family N-acetyltransferase [Candidatus Thermofonsia Clade 1 bacterium]|jgi:ribosomal protein S18 acetylase RimI-like enzyme|uniref:GNAT family N-acetyltransferase n=1 Tax=Candidatus Thermofonsia Clade 1 bacterium TaxID=2364210 RepID=A0A2M8PEW8_9CHLR|nr:MAG: GNAT family N-acetyltransferase [Candidatus Thermofonsia Clade 1 bacterium]RMF52934.1 MAG: GNAT family N-acetyltransferase [Chloroflexota bacterium]
MSALIRPAKLADARNIGMVQLDTWRSTYTPLVPAGFLDQFDYKEREQVWRARLSNAQAPQHVFVAEVDAQIVAFASGGLARTEDAPYTAEVYALYVREAYQRRGIGVRLVAALAERFAAEGHTHMLIWVLSENRRARAFYEAIGGTWLREKLINFGTNLLESAYGYVISDFLARYGAPKTE